MSRKAIRVFICPSWSSLRKYLAKMRKVKIGRIQALLPADDKSLQEI